MAHHLVGHVAWRSFARPTTHINSVCPAISKGYKKYVTILLNELKLVDVIMVLQKQGVDLRVLTGHI